MTYDGKLLARARGALERLRAGNAAELERRTALVYRRVPEIADIDARLRAQMVELARITLARSADMKARLAALERDNLALQARREALLVSHGFARDYLAPIYSCPKCRDTGTLPDGGMCDCLVRAYNREVTDQLGTLLRHGSESFERFDLSLYSSELDPRYGVVPREAMGKVFEVCRRFAESFPNVSSNLLLQGDTGLGKTYLSACIARTVAEKGCAVCYDSAAAALDAFEQQKFSRDTEAGQAAAARVKNMLECDLMILDDLGTEMNTPMSVSALYTLINTRLVSGKRMIISTNCSDDELERRYTPQICSRILGEFLRVPFAGRDIRQIRKT